MRSVSMRIMLPALMILTSATALPAQQSQSISNWANVNQLISGAEIRVTLSTGKVLRGFLQHVTPESISMSSTTGQETLLQQEIRRVALKRPGHRGRNTLLGLAIGTGVGLAVGAGVDSQSNGWFPNAGKAVLSPVGAMVGTVIGVALPTGGWRDVYRVPRDRN